ncbi:MAG TPA: PQQ-binding-like beta-propeller repeat protein [Gemmataceae bacterium]|jgi:outer membrane protein assembly factor BamB|nr:PQQ-binding-like beta-propeller repeat protein [Gemmataceae bacterium]
MLSRFAWISAGLLLTCAVVSAADWPQWRGPNRDEISQDKDLLTKFPPGGPKLLWSVKNAGVGYSGPAIVGDRLYSLGADEQANKEFVFAIDVKSGKEAWRTQIGAYKSTNYKDGWGGGPRCTPSVDGDLIFVLGVNSDLACLDKSGKKLWAKNLIKEFGGQMMSDWGYAESPLVDGDHLICSPGGNGGTLAALDKKSGKLIWRSKDLKDGAAYSSIIAADVEGVRQYIQLTGKGIAGVAATDGQLLWSVERPHRTATIPTAIYHDGYVYTTAGYGCGCALIKLTKSGNSFKAEEVYANKNMTNHHGGVVLVDGHIYGFSESGGWECQDFMSGKVVWDEKGKGRGKGSLTFADGRLYCYTQDDGILFCIDASAAGFKETGRFSIPQQSKLRKPSGRIWTHPVIANGKLYLRDQELLFCYDISAK